MKILFTTETLDFPELSGAAATCFFGEPDENLTEDLEQFESESGGSSLMMPFLTGPLLTCPLAD